MENSKFPFSLLSKVSFSWKRILGKSEGETTESCTEGPTANDDLREQDFNQEDKWSKERSPYDLHGEQCTGTCERNDDVDVPKTDRRSKFPLWLKKGKKAKTKEVESFIPDFRILRNVWTGQTASDPKSWTSGGIFPTERGKSLRQKIPAKLFKLLKGWRIQWSTQVSS